MQMPSGRSPAGDTQVQFHSDQIRLLVVHETQLAIYDASKMDLIRQVVLSFHYLFHNATNCASTKPIRFE